MSAVLQLAAPAQEIFVGPTDRSVRWKYAAKGRILQAAQVKLNCSLVLTHQFKSGSIAKLCVL